jgi:hypothetical protein
VCFVLYKHSIGYCDMLRQRPNTRPESYQVDHGRDSAACVVSRIHAVASHEMCSDGNFREIGITDEDAVIHKETPACSDTAQILSTHAVQKISWQDVQLVWI